MSSTCQIYRYQCPEDLSSIEHLAELANLQQERNSGFTEIFPWKDLCMNDYHYVARDKSGIICGWLTASLKTHKSRLYIHLNEISTRRIRNSLFGGVGQRLHSALIVDAASMGADFIYLYPLNDMVKEMYMNPEWDYKALRPGMKYLFHIIYKKPSKELLDTFMPIEANEIILQAIEIGLKRPKDLTLLNIIDLAKPMLLKDERAIKTLEDDIMIMEGNRIPLKEKKAELTKFFSEYLNRRDANAYNT